MPNFTFEKDTRKCFLDGKELPHVTDILKAEGFIDTTFMTPEGRHRGQYVHKGCELDDKGTLDESSFKPEYLGYLEAWRKYKMENNVEVIESEVRVYSPLWLYTGTLDKIIKVEGRLGLIDIKTGAPKKSDRFQLAAYKLAYEELFKDALQLKIAVYLQPNGKYTIGDFNKPEHRNDKQNWLSILTVYNLKHGGVLK